MIGKRPHVRKIAPVASSPDNKVCRDCGIEKPRSEFFVNRSSPDGLKHGCKACVSLAIASWQEKNPEKRKALVLSMRDKSRDARNKNARERDRALRHIDPERFRAEAAAWRANNPEKMKAYRKKRYDYNRASILAKKREEYRLNAETLRAQSRVRSKARYLADPERSFERARVRRARKAGAAGTFSKDDIAALMKAQSGKCAHAWCRSSLLSGKHIDHIMPLFLGGSNDRRNLQLLCAPCNLSKGAKHPIDFALQHGMLV